MSDDSLIDDNVPTAQRISLDPGWDFLEQVPFESLYRDLIAHACSTIELAAGHYGKKAVSAVLRSLPICDAPSADDLETFNRRADEGDITLLNDMLVEFDWQEIAANLVGLFMFRAAWRSKVYGPGRFTGRH